MPFSFTEAPIASRQNRRIVGLCKLADRGERERTGLFRFDGVKLLCEAVRREVPLTEVFVRAGSAGRVTERMAELYGLEPDALHVAARLNDQESIKNLVAAGLGLAIVSAVSVARERDRGDLLLFPLADAARSFYIVTRRHDFLSPAARQFFDFSVRFYTE